MKLAPVQPALSSDARNSASLATWLSIEPELQGLQVDELLVELGRQPELFLPLREDCAGNDAIDADAGRAEFTREGARHPVDGRFRGGVTDHAGTAAHPGDRAQHDDGAATHLPHPLRHGLCSEELVVEVEGERSAPVIRLHIGDRVTIVAAGIVDEDLDPVLLFIDSGQSCAQAWDVGQVADMKARAGLRRQGLAPCGIDVQEGDAGALRRKRPHHLLSDTRRAAGDDDGSVGERPVLDGAVIGHRVFQVQAVGSKRGSGRPATSTRIEKRLPE